MHTLIAFLAALGLGPAGVLAVLGFLLAILLASPFVLIRAWRPAPPRPTRRTWPAVEIPAATGPTTRLPCCATPDYPPGARHCIHCGRSR